MSQTFKSSGVLRYDPRHKKTRHEDWWLIAECGRGLVLLYKWMLEREATKVIPADKMFDVDATWPITQRGVKVSESAWKAHISVTRGERPRNPRAWKKYEGRRISFEYSPMLQTNGAHWWIPVSSPELEAIRKELGLPRVASGFEPEYYRNHKGIWVRRPAQYHLTIGKDVDSPPKKRRE